MAELARFAWKVEGTEESTGTMVRSHEEDGEVLAEGMGEAFEKVVVGPDGMEWGVIDQECKVTISLDYVGLV